MLKGGYMGKVLRVNLITKSITTEDLKEEVARDFIGGADHNRGYAFQEIFGVPIPEVVDRFASKGKGKLTKWNQDVRTATCDLPTMCAFLLDIALPAVALQNTADMVNSVTGFDLTPEEVKTHGERVNNLARAFNVREGLTREDDILPERMLTEPLKDGGSKGHYITKEELYEVRPKLNIRSLRRTFY